MTNKLYVCVARRDDHYVRKEGGKFDAEEFEKHPYRYASTFSQKVDLDIYITLIGMSLKCLNVTKINFKLAFGFKRYTVYLYCRLIRSCGLKFQAQIYDHVLFDSLIPHVYLSCCHFLPQISSVINCVCHVFMVHR